MRSRYQTIFTINDNEKQGLGLLEDVRAFIGGGVAEQFGEPDVASSTEGEWRNNQGKLRIDSEVREGAGFFSLSWERLDGWHLRWRLATLKEEVEADVQVSGPDNDTREAGPPSALDDILKRYRCRIQGYDMWGDVVQGISKENADWYADSVIFNPERTIPVVAISRQETLEGPARFQRAHMLLRGIAAVALPTRHDLPLINAKLGRLACSGGEVRVYQPGAKRDDDPSLHRKWRPSEVDWGEIRDECMHILALSRGPRLYHEVREEIVRLWEEEQSEEALGSLSSSAQIREKATEYVASVEERDAQETVIREARAEILELKAELLTLEGLYERSQRDLEDSQAKVRELETARDNEQGKNYEPYIDIGEYFQHPAENPERYESDIHESEEKHPEESIPPTSVFGVVSNSLGLEGLRFFDTAMTSAQESPYKDLVRLQSTLEALSKYAIERSRGPLGKTPKEWFSGQRVPYAANEGQQARQKYGRRFPDDESGESIEMPEHIRLGGGGNRDVQRVLRIHFKWSQEERKVLIGHVGRHLPNART